jgi:hypothetical protein
MRYIACRNQDGVFTNQRFTDHTVELENFARRYDKPNNSIFVSLAELKLFAGRRGHRMENVASLDCIHTDVDTRDIMATPAEVESRVMALPEPWEVRNSGGGFHPLLNLKEPARAGTVALEHLANLRGQATLIMAADPAVNRNNSLLRKPNTHNYKYGEPRLCRIIRPGLRVSMEEAGNLIGGLPPGPWFGKGPIDPVLNPRRIVRAEGEDDPYVLLKAMRPGSIQTTQWETAWLLMRDRKSLWQTVQIILRATKNIPECAGWDWRKEERDIANLCYRRVRDFPVLHTRLEEIHRVAWAALERDGKTPTLIYVRGAGWRVVEASPKEEPPTPVSDVSGWLRQTVERAAIAINAHAVHYAVHVSFDPTLRAKGYFREALEHTAQRWGVTVRTVERARALLIHHGYLGRSGGGGRIPRFVLTIPDTSVVHE